MREFKEHSLMINDPKEGLHPAQHISKGEARSAEGLNYLESQRLMSKEKFDFTKEPHERIKLKKNKFKGGNNKTVQMKLAKKFAEYAKNNDIKMNVRLIIQE